MSGYVAKGIPCPKGCGELIAVDPLDTMAERTQAHYRARHDDRPFLDLDAFMRGEYDALSVGVLRTEFRDPRD